MPACYVLLFLLAAAEARRILGAWHCGIGCTWEKEPDLKDSAWLLDRGDGKVTANLVILAFIDPVKLVSATTDTGNLLGLPRGMTPRVVNYFKSAGIDVMLSIGGETYIAKWEAALAQDPVALAKNAANISKTLGVGIEIDYEGDDAKSLAALDVFVKTYRSIVPFSSNSSAGWLTVDTGAGARYLTSVTNAAATWIANEQVNFMNAMVSNKPYSSGDAAISNWDEHLNGDPQLKVAPTPGQQFSGSLYAIGRNYNCASYTGSPFEGVQAYVKKNDLLGVFFWATGDEGDTTPVTDCPGIREGSKVLLG